MDESREQAIENGAGISTGGVNFNYVDIVVLERLGIGRYSTKKKDGNNFIRIVAPSAKGAFAKEIWKHSNVGSDNVTYLCLDKMFGERCPVCEYIAELKRLKVDSNVVKELNPSLRYLLFVIDITSRDTEDEGPKWFDCPITVYKEICSLSKAKRTGQKIDPTDPDDGRDIEFVRKDGRRTSYGGFVLTKNDPIPDSWFKDLPTFDEVLLMSDPNEMEVAVSGMKSSSKETSSEGTSRRDSSRRESKDDDKRDSGRDSGRRESRGGDRGRDSSRREGKDDSRTREERPRRDSRGDSNDTQQGDKVKSKLDEIKERRRNRENKND